MTDQIVESAQPPHVIGPKLKWILLIQSWSQFVSVLGVYFILFAMCSLFLWWFDHPAAFWFVMIAATVGTLPSLFFVLPGEFSIESSQPQTLAKNLERRLERRNYVRFKREQTGTWWRQNVSRMLRWREAEVWISVSGNRLVVRGPILLLRRSYKPLVSPIVAGGDSSA